MPHYISTKKFKFIYSLKEFWNFSQDTDYRKSPKYLDYRKIAVIILKFEQYDSTLE